MIGLATKAGKVASGEFCTEKEVKSGRAYLVIVADDASDNTKKKFQNMCDFYQVPIYFYKDKDTLGHAMGKEFRADLTYLCFYISRHSLICTYFDMQQRRVNNMSTLLPIDLCN